MKITTGTTQDYLDLVGISRAKYCQSLIVPGGGLISCQNCQNGIFKGGLRCDFPLIRKLEADFIIFIHSVNQSYLGETKSSSSLLGCRSVPGVREFEF